MVVKHWKQVYSEHKLCILMTETNTGEGVFSLRFSTEIFQSQNGNYLNFLISQGRLLTKESYKHLLVECPANSDRAFYALVRHS